MATHRQPATSSRRPAPAEQEPDEIIGDFRRGKEIGKGSFATVYLAKHRVKKSYAAVKAVQMSKLTRKLKENLTTEINILKSLQHPHIVALFTYEERPSYIYLVMEYCQLSDLAQFMKKKKDLLKYPETADIFRKYPCPEGGGLHEVLSRHFLKQVASALQYLRNRNLIHRDIKPQNLLLNPSPLYMAKQKPEDVPLAASAHSLEPTVGVASLPMLKIADFGFARHLPSTSMAETLCGSPLYMAPEILRYEKYDARADLWSTGTVLHEMVAGKPPFRAQNHVDLLRKIEKAGDVINFDKSIPISREMKDVIRRLLKKSPLDRVSYEDFFAHSVITDDIPGLVDEDLPLTKAKPLPEPRVSELSRRMAKQAIDDPAQAESSAAPQLRARISQDESQGKASRKPSDQDMNQRHADDASRRKSSGGSQGQADAIPKDVQRQPSQRQQRPNMVAHATAPGRQELHLQQQPLPSGARMERRASRTSPLAGPPMVREPTGTESEKTKETRAARDARERAARDVADERDYVVIEKKHVEVNAFADELNANANLQVGGAAQNHGTMVRRTTTQGQPTSTTGAQPASPSRAMQMMSGRPQALHQRGASFERRYVPSPQSATNMLAKALNAANVRLFGALGTSPPFGKGPSPPTGYGAFPTYPTPQGNLLLGEADSKTPMDEDSRIVRTMEEAAHRSDVIFGFAEVKYHQLLPATPSAQGGLGIQQLGQAEKRGEGADEDEDEDMTNLAIVGVAEEALVLYVKALAILAKTIDLAGYWWSKQSRGEVAIPNSASPRSTASGTTDVSKRMNNVVQWARGRFNECLEKSEVVARRLADARRKLPEEHPSHINNQTSVPGAVAGAVSTSTEAIRLTSGVTAEKLMFERAVEMSRASAVNELVGEELQDCEIGYVTAIMLLEAVLEQDDEPLMRKPSAKKDKPADEIVNGMETEDRQMIIKLIEGARSRLNALRKKMAIAAQSQAKRSSVTSTGNSTPKPASQPSPTGTPVVVGTPPRAA